MIWVELLKVDDSYIVTIPSEEVERLNLSEGQLLAIEIQPAEIGSVISIDAGVGFEESWQRNEPGYRYLAEQ